MTHQFSVTHPRINDTKDKRASTKQNVSSERQNVKDWKKSKIDIARNVIQKNISLEMIAEVTGLEIETIRQLT